VPNIRTFRHLAFSFPGRTNEALTNPRLVKRLTNVTLIIGFAFLADATLALFLSGRSKDSVTLRNPFLHFDIWYALPLLVRSHHHEIEAIYG
jgi:hypothetical protein